MPLAPPFPSCSDTLESAGLSAVPHPLSKQITLQHARITAGKASMADSSGQGGLHLPPTHPPLTPSYPPALGRKGSFATGAWGFRAARWELFSSRPLSLRGDGGGGVFIDELPQKPPPKISQKGLDNPSPTTPRTLPPFQIQSSHTRRAAVGRDAHLKREQLYNQRQSHPATFRKQGLRPKIPPNDLRSPPHPLPQPS